VLHIDRVGKSWRRVSRTPERLNRSTPGNYFKMSRQILCEKCAAGYSLHPEDAAAGWLFLKIWLRVKKPEVHQTKMTTLEPGKVTEEIHDIPSIRCDLCGADIPDGTRAAAVTMYQAGQVGEWEDEYGTRCDPPSTP
jgi:hypothetical protein